MDLFNQPAQAIDKTDLKDFYKFAYDAYRGTSFSPERRAEQFIK